MKKVYLDTNILIDILLDRDLEHISINKITPFLKQSQVYMSTLSVHITYYILKIKPNTSMHKKSMALINRINLVPLSQEIINQSLNNFSIDFEDTLQYYSALDQNCDYILTRDKKNFKKIKELIPSKIEIIDTLNTIL
ncbi:MAG TPA: type II toxin-antitoxin system VapC family toxin [Candidatus Dojkabacteria bacterium]|nr:type II toxin-antitoxin system VapC family toxin [Candidatus Dojkabacteria bacterium]